MAATKVFVGMLKRKRESYNLMKMSVRKGKKRRKVSETNLKHL